MSAVQTVHDYVHRPVHYGLAPSYITELVSVLKLLGCHVLDERG